MDANSAERDVVWCNVVWEGALLLRMPLTPLGKACLGIAVPMKVVAACYIKSLEDDTGGRHSDEIHTETPH